MILLLENPIFFTYHWINSYKMCEANIDIINFTQFLFLLLRDKICLNILICYYKEKFSAYVGLANMINSLLCSIINL